MKKVKKTDEVNLKAILGLSNIFSGLKSEDLPGGTTTPHLSIQTIWAHPFGLYIDTEHLKSTYVYFFGRPWPIHASVNAWIGNMRTILVAYNDKSGLSPSLSKLRVIKARQRDKSDFDIYYEAQIINTGTFICGLVNDQGDEFKRYKFMMDSIFALLSLVYGIGIDKTSMSYPDSTEEEKLLLSSIGVKDTGFNLQI